MRDAVVVVATYRRPEHVRTCLRHLEAQTVAPARIVVVDASPDDLTAAVVREFPHVDYRRNDLGVGTLAASRAIGSHDADEDVVAFIDDDAYAEPEWLERILAAYAPDDVGAVGGRARNNRDGEESEGLDRIGRFLPDGSLTGNFGADPGRTIDVDHMLGANMTVRTSVLREIGGIHDYYPGTCLREDSDISLRVRKAGYRIVYAPDAVVLHVAGDYARGRRFDLRYRFYGARNHVVLLRTTLGWGDPHLARHLLRTAPRALAEAVSGIRSWPQKRGLPARLRGLAGGVVRAGADVAGTVTGLLAAVRPHDRARQVYKTDAR
ncbi:glycosyltransferase family 2 protein [Microbacterium sp.]|uniref:glycosyltransferase family 2 protein n=1 Tax=Microbacterium sp. TaxID=51671 RepID=UPI002811E586|nr:glycosyltransferase family 2 protein [Microbacterium sp.]